MPRGIIHRRGIISFTIARSFLSNKHMIHTTVWLTTCLTPTIMNQSYQRVKTFRYFVLIFIVDYQKIPTISGIFPQSGNAMYVIREEHRVNTFRPAMLSRDTSNSNIAGITLHLHERRTAFSRNTIQKCILCD